MGILYSIFINENQHSTQVTDAHQAEDLPENFSKRSEVDPPQKDLNENITTETTLPPFVASDHINEVDKKSIIVRCAGKCKEFFIFPSERISVLRDDACDWAGKKSQNMKLVFKGEYLDVMKTVSEYPVLRAGSKVNLIMA